MIHYLVPDYSEPSWGVGMLYEHVRLLRASGYPACVLHHEAPFRLAWREPDVPVRYLDAPDLAPTATDVVVVPEVLAASAAAHRFPWRKVVFVQGGFLIVRGLGEAPDYRALGYEMAMAVLPHVVPVIERHFGIAARVVPPFVAPFFSGGSGAPRERRALLVVKEGYRGAGYPDAEIAGMLLDRELATRPGWQLSRLVGLTHREVAELM